jgi:hypothetical protein
MTDEEEIWDGAIDIHTDMPDEEIKQRIRDSLDGTGPKVHLDLETNPDALFLFDEVLHERGSCIGEMVNEETGLSIRQQLQVHQRRKRARRKSR